MPELVRLYIRHVLAGFGLSAIFTAALLWLDVGHLGHLVTTSDIGWIAGAMLFFANGIVFAGVQFAVMVMRMEERPEPPARGPLAGELVPVRLRARQD